MRMKFCVGVAALVVACNGWWIGAVVPIPACLVLSIAQAVVIGVCACAIGTRWEKSA
jgi:hypothetical protein